jgi:hypothetical protein
MQSTTGLFATTLVAAGLLALSPAALSPALAQAQSPSTPSPTVPKSTVAPPSIPDSKLDATAAAVKRVTEVREDFEQKVAQAPDADKERLANEANQALVKAVTDQGLSVEEYTTIMQTAQNDPVVRDKLVERLKK